MRKKLTAALAGAVIDSGQLSKKLDSKENPFNATARKSEIDSRFDRANKVLEQRPTGFTSAKDIHSHFTEEYGEPSFEVMPLDLIDDNPFNARQIYEPEKVKEMAEHLKQDGQLVPGIAVVNGGRRTLIAGHYRKQGLLEAGIPTMNLMVFKGLPDKTLFSISYKENTLRNKQTALDDALVWSQLLKKGLFDSIEDLSEHIGVSRGTVSKTLKILELSGEALEVIKHSPGSFSWTILYQLAHVEPLLPASEFIELLHKVRKGEISRAEIERFRKANEIAPTKLKELATHKQYDLSSPSGRIGRIRSWPDGRIQLDIKISDPQQQEQLLAELRDRFSKV